MTSRAADLSAIGQAVREVRTSRHVSQERLSLDAGIDRAFVSGLERGQRNLTFVNLMKVCRALDVQPSELFRLWEEHVQWQKST